MTCHEVVREATSYRTLHGEACLSTPLSVKSPDDGREFRLETVTLTIAGLAPNEKCPGPPIESYLVPVSFLPSFHHSGLFATCEVNVWVQQADFDQAWEVSDETTTVTFLVYLGAGSDPTPLELVAGARGETFVWARANLLTVTVEPEGAGHSAAKGLRERRERVVIDALRDHYTGLGHSSQVRDICRELAAGVARIEDENERAYATERVRDLLVCARQCFRGYSDSLHGSDKATFLAEMAKADKSKHAALASAYDTLWKHYRLVDAVSKGQSIAGPESDEIRCSDTEIEPVARMYAALNGIHSPTLESILIDALMYSECLGTAQRIHSGIEVNGQLLGAPLVPMSTWHIVKTQLPKTAWANAKEVAKLALTYVAARLITSGDPAATWVVFCAYTLFRWMRRMWFWRELMPHRKLAELLDQMCNANEFLARQDFNPRDLRRFIHTLTPSGCRFSPWVLNLLDRRIASAEHPP